MWSLTATRTVPRMVARAFSDTSGMTSLSTSPCVTTPAGGFAETSVRTGVGVGVALTGDVGDGCFSLVFFKELGAAACAACCEGCGAGGVEGGVFEEDLDAPLGCAAAGMGFADGALCGSTEAACWTGAR